MKKLLFVFGMLIIGLTSSLLNAQTNVSGMISSNTTWTLANSPYIVTGNVLLDSGYTLTIQPGVIVKFDSLKCLQIGGTLTAIGTSGNPITFTSNQTTHVAGYWGYIFFNETGTDYDTTAHTGSILKYCIVEYGGNQNVTNSVGVIRSGNNYPITLALPFIDHCTVRNNTTRGISIGSGFGVNARTGALLRITNCDIYNNSSYYGSGYGGGIDASVVSSDPNFSAVISGNKIHDNYGDLGGGIICNVSSGNNNSVTNNIIYNNKASSGGGIYVVGFSTSYNIFYNNTASDAAAVYLEDGGGIGTHNIIVNNTATTASGCILAAMMGDNAYYNTIIDNNVQGMIVASSSGSTLGYNTITRNTATAYPPTTAVSFQGEPGTNFQHNNIYKNNTTYQFWNNNSQGKNVDARYCWWGTTSTTTIDSAIWDYFDDGTFSIVNYSPFQTSPDTAAPVTPPANVIKTYMGGGNIKITWNANLETDLAGYKVYWGSPTGYSFAHSVNVGNALTYTLSEVSFTDTIAVTAYDTQMDGVQDQFEGHESWFTNAVTIPASSISITPSSIAFGPVQKDTTRQLLFTITNSSISVLQIDSLWTQTKYFNVAKTLTVGNVKLGDTTRVTIGFTPDSMRSFIDTMFIANNSLVSPFKVPLGGNGTLTGIQQVVVEIPTVFSLAQNYPNPFNPATTISFSLPIRSFASLKVFDLIGREVATIVSEEMSAGNYSRQWNAAALPSGIYFYRLQASNFTETKKLVLLR